MASNESKTDRALDMALQRIEKSFGKGAVMQLGQGERQRIETIPSGALSLDIAL